MNVPGKEQTRFIRKPYFNIYKPLSKADAGAALQFSYDNFKKGVFLEATRQKGEKLEIGSKDQFDWSNEKKITFKIGMADVGQLLLLFSGRKTEVKCIHKPKDGAHTSVLEVKKQTGTYDNYQLKLSRTEKDEEGNKTTRNVQIYIDHHEMALLSSFVRESLTYMFGFPAVIPSPRKDN